MVRGICDIGREGPFAYAGVQCGQDTGGGLHENKSRCRQLWESPAWGTSTPVGYPSAGHTEMVTSVALATLRREWRWLIRYGAASERVVGRHVSPRPIRRRDHVGVTQPGADRGRAMSTADNTVAVVTDVGPTRKRHQDAVLVPGVILSGADRGTWNGALASGSQALVQVIDGMGGHAGGSLAAGVSAMMNELLSGLAPGRRGHHRGVAGQHHRRHRRRPRRGRTRNRSRMVLTAPEALVSPSRLHHPATAFGFWVGVWFQGNIIEQVASIVPPAPSWGL